MILARGIIDGFEVQAIFTSAEAARLAGYEVVERPRGDDEENGNDTEENDHDD